MAKYRIVKHICYGGNTRYEVQKRFLGFLWWYNFENIDGAITGIYSDIQEAVEAIYRDQFKCEREIIEL